MYWAVKSSIFAAANLQIGEHVQTRTGTLTLQSSQAQDTTQTVYNLEIYGEHNYLVQQDGLWVHNTCDFLNALKSYTRQVGHTLDHFVEPVLSSRPASQLFKAELSIEKAFAKAADIIENHPDKIISTGTSEKGAMEIVLDFGESVNRTGTTSKVRIWLNAEKEIGSIHPYTPKK